MTLPRILIIDDVFGREVSGSLNDDRLNLCLALSLDDRTGDGVQKSGRRATSQAQATFFRGQLPITARPGDTVENDLESSLARVRSGWTAATTGGEVPWSLLLLDLCFYTGRVTEESHHRASGMPEGRHGDDDPRFYFGLTLLDSIHREFPELPIFILSSKPREEVSLELSRRGALGFIDRSDLRAAELLQETLWQHALLPDPSGEIIGNSLAILLALREARRAALHRENLLLRGERGTGKELLARYVHRCAEQKGEIAIRPFAAVNSAVFTPNLFASELFGIQPRTATGVDGKLGLIALANHGDVFLDEIADMPLEVQAAFLRVLQERQITPVGSRQPIDVDVRFLSATNADLEDPARSFRSDLLDRLCLGGTVWLPPLRERLTDIPLLVEKFIREAESQRRGCLRREVTSEAMEALCEHHWPGNVRELRSVIFDAVNRFPDVEHLVPEHLRLGGLASSRKLSERARRQCSEPIAAIASAAGAFDEISRRLNETAFEPREVTLWAGKLGTWQREHARFLARYLGAALEATKRRTPGKPQGVLQIHPAVRLITGDATLTASKAADVIKRLLGPLEDELDGDLAEAYEIALRLRPKSTTTAARNTAQRAS